MSEETAVETAPTQCAPWPEREMVIAELERDLVKVPEGDSEYLIRMIRRLFVEIAQMKAMLEKP